MDAAGACCMRRQVLARWRLFDIIAVNHLMFHISMDTAFKIVSILCAVAVFIGLAAAHWRTPHLHTAVYGAGKRIDYIESDGLRPAILFIHGGGWVFGNRTACTDLCESFSDAFDCYACDYTLGAEGAQPPWEQTIEDIAEAVAWIRNRKGVRQVFLVGISAGGHLALYHAANCRDVHGAVAISAPTDLEKPFCKFVEKSVRIWAGDELEAASVQPTPRMPPVCIVHGDFDSVVPVEHADSLVRRCLEADIKFEYHRFHGGVHCLKERQEMTWDIVREFLAHLAP